MLACKLVSEECESNIYLKFDYNIMHVEYVLVSRAESPDYGEFSVFLQSIRAMIRNLFPRADVVELVECHSCHAHTYSFTGIQLYVRLYMIYYILFNFILFYFQFP